MKKLILWLFVSLFLVWNVCGLEVSLISPVDNAVYVDSRNVNFKCNATGVSLVQIILYSDISGTWDQTDIYDASGTFTEANFVITNIPNGDYKWSCKVVDNEEGLLFALQNRTFSINIPPNSPPIFNGPIQNQSWDKNTPHNNAFNLNDYFSDPDTEDLSFSVSGNVNINIVISDEGNVSFSQPENWFGVEYVIFSATDGINITDSNLVKLTVTDSGSPPTFSCSDATVTWDKNNDKTVDLDDYCDHDATYVILGNEPDNIDISLNGDDATFDPDNDWTGTQTVEFNATWGGLSDTFVLTLKVEEPGSSSNEEEKTCSELGGDKCSSEEICEGNWLDASDTSRCCSVSCKPKVETGLYIIKSYYPSSKSISLNKGSSKKFKVEPSGDTEVRWYLDEKKVGEGTSYNFKAEKEGTYELVAVIGNNPSLSKNDDFCMWTVNVDEEDILATNICGNNRVDEGENCENCPRDVKCAEGEVCKNGECVRSKSFFSRVSGFVVNTKDFVVKKWKYSSIIGGVIVILIVCLLIYISKKKRKDFLYEFGRESFFSKIRSLFRRKRKGGYVAKRVEESVKPVVEKEVEFYIDKKQSYGEDRKI